MSLRDRAGSNKLEFIQHLCIANGSLAELETHIQLAERLGYFQPEAASKLLNRAGEVGRLLNGLLRFLRGGKAVSGRQPATANR
jgi:four helix bundle protein